MKIKEKVYHSCVRPAMLYGSETWYLREAEIAILRRTERSMVRTMCGVKLVDRNNISEMMNMLKIKTTANQLTKANRVRWNGHVLKRTHEDILRNALAFKVNGKQKRGRPRMTWRSHIEDSLSKVGLEKMVAVDRSQWREGMRKISESTMRSIWPPPSTESAPD